MNVRISQVQFGFYAISLSKFEKLKSSKIISLK